MIGGFAGLGALCAITVSRKHAKVSKDAKKIGVET
jgi:hypothetical protein